MTLLEVVVAVVVLTSLAFAATLVSLPVSRQTRISREVAIANGEAKRILEKVHAVPFPRIASLYPNGAELPVIMLQNGKITTTYEDPNADPLVLRAVLTWDSPDLGPMMRTFFTVRTK